MGFIQLKLPKRIRKKIENSKRNREAQARHEEWLQSQGLDTYTLKQKTRGFKGYDIPQYKPDPNHPKCSDRIPVGTGKKEEMRSSVERKLLGIGMMHKSNLVPIWDEEGAKEISTMRRN
jgi:hypothetical protein